MAFFCVVVLIAGFFSAAVCADDGKPPSKTTELARLQRMTKQDFEKLTAEMLKLAGELEEKDPDSAKVLREAVNRARGAYEISQDMEKVAEYLLKGLTELASRRESEVIEKLKKLLRLLSEGVLDVDRQLVQLRQWQHIRRQIDNLIAEQRHLEHLSAMQSKAAEIEGQIQSLDKRISELIAEQQKLLDKTEKLAPGETGIKKIAKLRDDIGRLIASHGRLVEAAAVAESWKLPVLGGMQKELSSQADKAGRALKQAAEDEDVRGALKEPEADSEVISASAGKVAEAAEDMRTASEALEDSDARGAEEPQQKALDQLKAAHDALSDLIAKAAASTPAGKLAADQKGLAEKTQQADESLRQTAQSVGMSQEAPDLSKAADQMDKAAGRLSAQDSTSAAAHQKKALEELKKQRDELAELYRRIRKELAKPMKKQAAEQADLAGRAGDTSSRMKGSEGAKDLPGRQSMQKASKSMSRASDQLSGGESSSANASQKEALRQLQRARDMLDEAIARARERLQEQSIAKIDSMLEAILKKQQGVSAETSGTYTRRKPEGYSRPEQITLAKLSSRQGELGGEVDEVRDLLTKEGTTVVFPAILGEVRRDMVNASKLLGDRQAGSLTQEIQSEIERNLQDMIDAIRKELAERRRIVPAAAGCCGGGKRSLVSGIAELKLLLALQKQINRRTVVLSEQKAEGELTAQQDASQHKQLAEREEKVRTMTAAIKHKVRLGRELPSEH
jgi:hypothetical protein